MLYFTKTAQVYIQGKYLYPNLDKGFSNLTNAP